MVWDLHFNKTLKKLSTRRVKLKAPVDDELEPSKDKGIQPTGSWKTR